MGTIKGYITENIDNGTMYLGSSTMPFPYGINQIFQPPSNPQLAIGSRGIPQLIASPTIIDDTSDFDVADIPAVMRNLKWKKGAAVMEKWFSLSAKKMTLKEKINTSFIKSYPEDYIDEKIFTMDWILGFSRANDAYATLKSSLSTSNAKKEIKKLVEKDINASYINTVTIPIKNSLDPKKLHLYWQFQFAGTSYDWRVGMDDLYAALGNFALYASILEGSYTIENNIITKIHISKVGIYMKDTFDFIGDQYLGHWNEEGMGIEPIQAALNSEISWNLAWFPKIGWAYPYGNSDYRDYRSRIGRGGDLMLFSDVRIINVNINL
jgi:hypothetical protein